MNERVKSVALACTKGYGLESFGASGILIADDLILTHGSLLNGRATSDPKIREFFEGIVPGDLTHIPDGTTDDFKVRIYQRDDKHVEIGRPEIKEGEGFAIVAWKCPLLENIFREIFYSWSFEKNGKSERTLLSIFLVVFLRKKTVNRENDEIFRAREALDRFLDNASPKNPRRGYDVEITSTPFGNPVFIDSVSRGVVSNVFGDDGCVMITDANTVPGSEGAPVYVTTVERTYICGMVIAPLSWCRGEWVDYTFVAGILPCLRKLLRSTSLNESLIDTEEMKIAESLDKSLVLVRCGDGWGTGIVFDAKTGTVITCSHVVQKAPESRIKVVLRRDDDSRSSNAASWAKLVYRTPRGEPYDVAVLRLDPSDLQPALRSIKIGEDRTIISGETVGSAGFPFFSSRFATITRGNVSGITDCMLRTTCCVQSGSSGGPIVRWSTGEMLGMVVCNAIAINKTKLYPRLNMAVPMSVLRPPISEYLRTGNVKALDALRTKDPIVRRTWNFYRLPSSKM